MVELASSGADSILALGGTAASATLDDNRGITSLRVGPPKTPTQSLLGSTVLRVIPTWHPAYCLRSADNFPALVTDVGKLRESTKPPWKPPTFAVVDTEEEALIAIHALIDGDYDRLVVDIETGLDKDVSFDHPNNFDLLCVGLGYAKGRAVVIGEEACKSPAVLGWLKRLLLKVRIIAHNGKFDLSGLFPKLGALKLWFDTMLAHYSLDERTGAPIHGLKVLAVEELGAPDYALEISTYVSGGRSYANIPRPLLYKYNAYDLGCTWDLYELFSERMDRNDVRRVHDHMVRASNELMYLELNGITVDREYARVLQGDYQERLAAIEAALGALVYSPTSSTDPSLVKPGYFNPRSPKQVKEFLYSQGIRTESTDIDHLTVIMRRIKRDSKAGQFITKLLEYRFEQKRFSTYVMGIQKRLYRGRVYTTYMLHGTTSGRLSSRNPNLQNITRDKPIRRQFIPASPDNVLMQCLVPGTRLLMRDATWRNVEDILPGEELVGFEEDHIENMIPSTATKTSRVMKHCYKVTLANGTEIVCSEDHKWVVALYGRTTQEWRTTKELASMRSTKTTFRLFAEPWEVDESRNGGYIAGFLDGEASVDGRRLTWGQNDGLVASKVFDTLTKAGFEVSKYEYDKACKYYYVAGNRGALRALGTYRPLRLMHKVEPLLFGAKKQTPISLVSIEYVGEREVVALETSSHTFIAEGFLSHNCDYKNVEARVMTTMAQDEYLRELLSNPDPNYKFFNELSDELYGVGKWDKNDYVRTKAYFYGIGYGRQPYSIAMEHNIPVSEATKRYNAFTGLIPGIVAWQAATRKKVLAGEDLVTPFGRKRRFHLITEENRDNVLNEALSHLPQSTASDICLSSLIRLRPMLRGIGWIRLTLHDALVVETPRKNLETCRDMMKTVMEEEGAKYTDYVPFPVDFSVGDNWGDL
jgi:DNA polymerase I-like protein with 3'-5' exonuclease and polymerase domains